MLPNTYPSNPLPLYLQTVSQFPLRTELVRASLLEGCVSDFFAHRSNLSLLAPLRDWNFCSSQNKPSFYFLKITIFGLNSSQNKPSFYFLTEEIFVLSSCMVTLLLLHSQRRSLSLFSQIVRTVSKNKAALIPCTHRTALRLLYPSKNDCGSDLLADRCFQISVHRMILSFLFLCYLIWFSFLFSVTGHLFSLLTTWLVVFLTRETILCHLYALRRSSSVLFTDDFLVLSPHSFIFWFCLYPLLADSHSCFSGWHFVCTTHGWHLYPFSTQKDWLSPLPTQILLVCSFTWWLVVFLSLGVTLGLI